MFESKVTLIELGDAITDFSQTFFEQNVSVQLKLMRFSVVFFISK